MHLGTKTAVGISVADHVIEVVELAMGKKPSIRARNRTSLDAGVIVGGAIRDEKKLAEAFVKLFAEAKPVPVSGRHVVFGVPESATYFHIFETQKISGEYIAAEVTRNIPLPAEDIAWGYRVFSQSKDVSRVVVAAASRALVDSWQKFLSTQGITIDIFDIEVFAIFRNLFREFPREPVLVVDIGAETTAISIFDSAGLVYTRSIRIAGEYLTREIATALKIAHDEAEEKKVAMGLEDREHPIFFALVKGLEMITREMRAAQEYVVRTHTMRISEIVLAGGSSRIRGLSTYMEANFGVTVVEASPTSDVEAVGYALRGLETRWDVTDPKIVLEQKITSWHIPKPSIHWSMPHASPRRWWRLFTQ
ncbi:MAG: hypothetical protein EXS68_01605 [Candidatus Ryanbacteria bacterium]|nr:hypothetical protein [Candidatus Ryanbacteria bacterium]